MTDQRPDEQLAFHGAIAAFMLPMYGIPALEDLIAQKDWQCRHCGCTPLNACRTEDGPCHWLAPNLCSECGGI